MRFASFVGSSTLLRKLAHQPFAIFAMGGGQTLCLNRSFASIF